MSLAVRRCPAHWRKSLFSLLIRALAGPARLSAAPAPGPGDPPRGPRRQLPARSGAGSAVISPGSQPGNDFGAGGVAMQPAFPLGSIADGLIQRGPNSPPPSSRPPGQDAVAVARRADVGNAWRRGRVRRTLSVSAGRNAVTDLRARETGSRLRRPELHHGRARRPSRATSRRRSRG